MHSNPRRLVTGVIVLCCLAVGAVGGASVEPARAIGVDANTGTEPKSQKSEIKQIRGANTTPTRTVLAVDLAANGTGFWTVGYRFDLDTANESAAFDRLSADIASDPSRYRDRFRQRMVAVSATAADTTGRAMRVTDVNVSADRTGSTGTVSYEFRWHDFAAATDDRLRIDGGLAGLSLDETTRLTVRWPAEYAITTLQPAPSERQSNAATWTGAGSAAGGLTAELVVSNSTANVTGAGAEGGSDGGLLAGNGLPLVAAGLAALVLLVGSLGVFRGARRWRTEETVSGSDTRTDPDPDGASNEPRPADSTHSDGDVRHPEPVENESEPDLDLLSNEEQVLAVLERSGRRAKQQHVVSELGWTDAKTSSVVSKLRDDGVVEGFRLGRENVLSLPDDATDESAGVDES